MDTVPQNPTPPELRPTAGEIRHATPSGISGREFIFSDTFLLGHRQPNGKQQLEIHLHAQTYVKNNSWLILYNTVNWTCQKL